MKQADISNYLLKIDLDIWHHLVRKIRPLYNLYEINSLSSLTDQLEPKI